MTPTQRPVARPVARPIAIMAALIAAVVVAGCGRSEGEQGRLSLQLSGTIPQRADYERAWLEISGITVQHVDGSRLQIGFDDPRRIDLAELTESGGARLLAEETLPAGRYDRLHLHLNTRGKHDTYLVLDSGAERELVLADGGQLRVDRPFVVRAGDTTGLTIHFDMRQPLRNAGPTPESYGMDPLLRAVPTATATHIVGRIGREFANRRCGQRTHSNLSLHVFEGAGVQVTGNDPPAPMASVEVAAGAGNAPWHYSIAWLPPGEYTLALACAGRTEVRTATDGGLFTAVASVTTRPSETTRHDFTRLRR